MRSHDDYIGNAVTLQAETRLEMMRRFLPTKAEVLEARRAGMREAQEATRVSGFNYTAAYERMCLELSKLLLK